MWVVLTGIVFAGLTGLTAYFGLLDVGKVKAGDFVVVSGAAGVYLFPDQNLVPVAIQSYAAFAKTNRRNWQCRLANSQAEGCKSPRTRWK